MGIVELIGKNHKRIFHKDGLPPFRWNGIELNEAEINEMCQKDMWRFYKRHGIDFRSPTKERVI